MNRLKDRCSKLRTGDVSSIIFFSFLSILNVIFSNRIEDWWWWVIINSILTSFIILLINRAEAQTGIMRIVRDWYWYPLILIAFKEVYVILRPINPVDCDALLIQIDYWLFGVNPTQWLHQFAHPLLTEYLQLFYSMFYIFPFLICFSLYRREKYQEYYHAFFLILYGFYLSYIGYLVVPAIGPRFTLHEFQALDKELPGVLLADILRFIINTGESIPHWIPNPAAVAQRDCFPSGHTEVTLIVMYLCWKYKSKTAYFLFPAGISLIVATVYLRYHYVIDLIAGAAFTLFAVWSGAYIERWWKDKVRAFTLRSERVSSR